MPNRSINLSLLTIVVIAWGLSWYAIVLQVEHASALISLTYRFTIAALLMITGLIISRRLKPIAWKDQPLLLVLGSCLFSFNFLLFYIAAQYLASGILSVIFATTAMFSAVNGWLFFGQKVAVRVLIAIILGVVGLGLLLLPEFKGGDDWQTPWWVYVLPFAATYLFSLGNLASARLSSRYDLANVVGQGMLYGAAMIAFVSLITQEGLSVPNSLSFWGATFFLAIIASIVAFITYLALVNRVGNVRASFATILFPLVAMIVSSIAEGFEWSVWSAFGILLVLTGTYGTFARN